MTEPPSPQSSWCPFPIFCPPPGLRWGGGQTEHVRQTVITLNIIPACLTLPSVPSTTSLRIWCHYRQIDSCGTVLCVVWWGLLFRCGPAYNYPSHLRVGYIYSTVWLGLWGAFWWGVEHRFNRTKRVLHWQGMGGGVVRWLPWATVTERMCGSSGSQCTWLPCRPTGKQSDSGGIWWRKWPHHLCYPHLIWLSRPKSASSFWPSSMVTITNTNSPCSPRCCTFSCVALFVNIATGLVQVTPTPTTLYHWLKVYLTRLGGTDFIRMS